jgi:hypothetical protein
MKYDIDGLQFRTLHADEIELRVGTVSAKGATLLLYQDSRCAMNILDETVGRSNWQRDHKELKGNLYCGIGIWDDAKSQWVWKWDCGTESNTEKEKGEASDSLKRSAVNWGIARELYSSPFIFVKCDTKSKQNGYGYELVDKFFFSGAKVSDIEYDSKRKIKALTIVDKDGVLMYSYPKGKKQAAPKKTAPKKEEPKVETISIEDAKWLKDKLMETNSDTAKFLAYVSNATGHLIASVDSMTYDEFDVATTAITRKMEKGNN